ncbi:MAG: redoxin domain-containing protein, partial [Proteobacteria bacterium]|nr:redoxin domain-containing protein [Pseudomonadota bacterium]
FWASWCVACRQEAHILEAAHQKYFPKGAVFIGIAINDTRSASLSFIERYGKTYNLAPDDKTGNISLNYGVTAVPETFFIDKAGIIREKILGAVQKRSIEKFLDNQLGS